MSDFDLDKHIETMKAEIKEDEEQHVFRWIADPEDVKPLIQEIERLQGEVDVNWKATCLHREKEIKDLTQKLADAEEENGKLKGQSKYKDLL